MTDITIYYNPKCGTCRNTLDLIRNTGVEPRVIDYLETPPSRDELVELITGTGASVCDLMRRKQEIFNDLGLADTK